MGVFDALLGLGSALGGMGMQDDYDDNPIANILGVGDINKDIRGIAGPMGGVNLMQQILGANKPQPQNLPPGTISEAGAMGTPAPQGEDIMVNGPSRWQPRKPTILGAIADAYLMSNGLQPAYSMFRDRRNVNEAMADFTESPMGAIRRLSRIPGHEQDAVKLYDQERDNNRADQQSEILNEARTEKFRDNLASYMMSANKSNWSRLFPYFKRYAEAHGLEPPPEQYDEDVINMYRMGGFTPDQIADNERDLDKSIMLEQGRNARYSYGQNRQDARTGMIQDRIDNRYMYGQSQQNARQDKSLKAQSLKQKGVAAIGGGIFGSGKFLEKEGQRVGELSPDGKYKILYTDNPGIVRVYDLNGKFLHESAVPK